MNSFLIYGAIILFILITAYLLKRLGEHMYYSYKQDDNVPIYLVLGIIVFLIILTIIKYG